MIILIICMHDVLCDIALFVLAKGLRTIDVYVVCVYDVLCYVAVLV